MKGLPNLGDTCYFNAALQCLVFSPNTSNYMLRGCETSDVNNKRKLASALATSFADFTRQYWLNGAVGDVADASHVFAAFTKACKGFPPGQQHDAHEALVHLLDKMHEGLSRMKPGNLATMKVVQVNGPHWSSSLKHETSVFSEVFRGQVEHKVTSVGYDNITYDHFTTLSLPIHEASSLSACFTKFMEPEHLEGFEVDSVAVSATLTKVFTYLPRVLVVHLKRFTGQEKVDRFVDYPFELNLCPFSKAGIDASYELFAVCFHRGSSTHGHYTMCGEAMGHWFYIDDEVSKQMHDINHVIQRDAYILLYKRL